MGANRFHHMDVVRFITMSLSILMVAAGFVAFINILPNTIIGTVTAVVAGLVITPLLASPFQWFVQVLATLNNGERVYLNLTK